MIVVMVATVVMVISNLRVMIFAQAVRVVMLGL